MDVGAWCQQVEGALQNAEIVTSDGDVIEESEKGAILGREDKTKPAAHAETHDARPEVDASEAKEAHGSNLSDLLEQLVADIDLETVNSTSDEAAPQTHESKDEQLVETEQLEHRDGKELGKIEKHIICQAATEKATARSKAFSIQPKQQASQQKEKTDVDVAIIRRCLQSAIPSIAATTGTDILELISLDILNHHLGLNIDLSDSWKRVLKPQSAFASIEMFLAECAPDPFAWSVLRREWYFKFSLGSVVQEYEQEEKKTNNRECLIGILETLRDKLEGDVEWEIVPEKVPRAVMRIAVAIAKDGPNPPYIDWSDESYSIDPFLLMVAEKSDSSLFGTPDSDNPRYWEYWMQRDGCGSRSS
ncbi:hypothetical protein CC78DRAFT_571365 [Lojkania enalia]|uniref:Uncharacterized protein n=1 Tax=Lojkania enalia TaxID=147567 RepID=A0A9P4JZR5_9PLEO|nr:hypothetical protein CC78DRAFT_571365 [Didymosphaeria enalia]